MKKGAGHRWAAWMLAAVVLAAGCAAPRPAARPDPVPKPSVTPRAAWGAAAPLGHEVEGARRNLGAGESVRLSALTVGVEALHGDSVVLVLAHGRRQASRAVAEGTAFRWEGYRVAVPAVRTESGELGGGRAELEIAPTASLPPALVAADSAGGAESRLRIPHDVRTITLHHSGTLFEPGDDAAAKLRALQAWGRRDRGWWDLPYHFLIDLDGRIYEGRDPRYRGETNTGYDVDGHLLISVMGNYSRQEPTTAQIEAIVALMAWAASTYDVPLDRVYGHGDLAETSCPGTHLRRYLDDGTFRRGVEARLRGDLP